MKRLLSIIIVLLFVIPSFATKEIALEVVGPVTSIESSQPTTLYELCWDEGPVWILPFVTNQIWYHAVWFDVIEFGLNYPINLNDIKIYLPDYYYGDFFITYEDAEGLPNLTPALFYGWIYNIDTTWQWTNSWDGINIEITQPFYIVLKGYTGMYIAGDLGDEEGGSFEEASITYLNGSSGWDWYNIIWYNGSTKIGFIDNCFRALVSTSDAIDDNLPIEYDLSLFNYPNPFNARTNISFELKEVGNVSLDVYNLLGQKVDYIALGTLVEGQHIVNYDAANLTAGIYFYSLNIDGVRIVTNRFNLLK